MIKQIVGEIFAKRLILIKNPRRIINTEFQNT